MVCCESMSPPVAVCQQVVGGRDGLDDLRLAAAGFEAVSLHTSRLGTLPAERWRRALSDAGLRAAGVMAIRGILDDPPDADDMLHAAGVVGATYVAVTTGPLGGRGRAEADEACAAWFARMQPPASRAGLRLALEPLHPVHADKSYVHTARHALAVTSRVPGAGIVVDSGHVWWDVDLVADLYGALDSVATIQLADVDGRLVARGGYDRVPFGTGVVPNPLLVRELLHHGYRGPFEIETLDRGDGRVARLATARRAIDTILADLPSPRSGPSAGTIPTPGGTG